MSYSTNVKNKHQKERQRNLLISWAVCLVVGILIGFLVTIAVTIINEADESPVSSIEPISKAVNATPTISTTPPVKSTKPMEKVTSLGEYKLTAYCPCEACCGKWSKNRPTDADGNLLVKTASGAYAKEGMTIAADTSILPFGTTIRIDESEYIVQDRGGSVKGNQIDIYFDNHQEALEFGVQLKEIFIIERMNEND